jgi:hypothetical protein
MDGGIARCSARRDGAEVAFSQQGRSTGTRLNSLISDGTGLMPCFLGKSLAAAWSEELTISGILGVSVIGVMGCDVSVVLVNTNVTS